MRMSKSIVKLFEENSKSRMVGKEKKARWWRRIDDEEKNVTKYPAKGKKDKFFWSLRHFGLSRF